MDDITFEEFKKLDIRVAKVLDAQEIAGADKLYLLTVDIGSETRTLVAGIKAYYPEREALIGRKVVVLVNLAPKTIRGVESHGMILAASWEPEPGARNVGILTVEKDIPPGSPVS